MISPVWCRCQVIPFVASLIGPAPYITTKLVGLVKLGAPKWLTGRLIGVKWGLNGMSAVFAV
jgi:hypothetical protein